MSTPEPGRKGPAEIVVDVLGWFAILASNPALGGGGMKRERLAILARRLALLIQGGSETWEEMKAFALEVKHMADTGTEPSNAVWQAMIDRDQVVRATLDAREVEIRNRMAAEQAERDRVEREVAEEAERQRAEEAERDRLAAEEAERQRLADAAAAESAGTEEASEPDPETRSTSRRRR